MLKRILLPSVLLYGFLGLFFVISYAQKKTAHAPVQNQVAHRVSPTATRTPPTPTILPDTAAIGIEGQVRRVSARHFEFTVSIRPRQNVSIDAGDFSLLAPLESVEITQIAQGDLLPLCPKMEQEGNFYNTTCSTPHNAISLTPAQKTIFLTYSILLREPYKSETIAINLAKTVFYHNGNPVPQYSGVTQFTLTEP